MIWWPRWTGWQCRMCDKWPTRLTCHPSVVRNDRILVESKSSVGKYASGARHKNLFFLLIFSLLRINWHSLECWVPTTRATTKNVTPRIYWQSSSWRQRNWTKKRSTTISMIIYIYFGKVVQSDLNGCFFGSNIFLVLILCN